MSGSMSRRKGMRGELEVAALLRRVFPDVRRRASGEESQGGQGRDLDGTPGFAWQVQLGDRTTPEKKLAEAAGSVKQLARESARTVPIAATRRTRGDWLVTLRLEDFLGILEVAQNGAVGGDFQGAKRGGEPDQSGPPPGDHPR
jgi:hypothetical protein